MACDGEIANEEVALLAKMIKETKLFGEINVQELTEQYVEQINLQGSSFLSQYLRELKDTSLTPDEQFTLLKIAIKTIEADNKIQYQEISFFKKIRKLLSVSDEDIKGLFQDKEQIELYLLPDIEKDTDFDIMQNVTFQNINIITSQV